MAKALAVLASVVAQVVNFGSLPEFRKWFVELVWTTGKKYTISEIQKMVTVNGTPVNTASANFYDTPKHGAVIADKEMLLKWYYCATNFDVRSGSNKHVMDKVLPAFAMNHGLKSAEDVTKAAVALRATFEKASKKAVTTKAATKKPAKKGRK
jgi:hypothetical protein